jgi:hypothetical protein
MRARRRCTPSVSGVPATPRRARRCTENAGNEANTVLLQIPNRANGSCYSRSLPSPSAVALSHVRCRLLRSTFAATAPRSAVSELESFGVATVLVLNDTPVRACRESGAPPEAHGLASRRGTSAPSQAVWRSRVSTASARPRFSSSPVSPVSTEPRF